MKKKLLFQLVILFCYHILTKSYGFIVGYEGCYVYQLAIYQLAICSDSYIFDSYLGSLNNSFVSYLTYS